MCLSLTTTAPAVKPATAGKIVILLSADPPSLDAVVQSAGQIRNPTQDNIYEGLLSVDNEMKLLPGLATSWERIDSTRTRFKLVSGAKFHNGEPFSADAIVASVKRVLDPEAKESGSSTKPNSWLDQSTISPPRRERCMAQIEAADR